MSRGAPPESAHQPVQDLQLIAGALGLLGDLLAPPAECRGDEPAHGQGAEGHDVVRLVDLKRQVRLVKKKLSVKADDRGDEGGGAPAELGDDIVKAMKTKARLRRR